MTLSPAHLALLCALVIGLELDDVVDAYADGQSPTVCYCPPTHSEGPGAKTPDPSRHQQELLFPDVTSPR